MSHLIFAPKITLLIEKIIWCFWRENSILLLASLAMSFLNYFQTLCFYSLDMDSKQTRQINRLAFVKRDLQPPDWCREWSRGRYSLDYEDYSLHSDARKSSEVSSFSHFWKEKQKWNFQTIARDNWKVWRKLTNGQIEMKIDKKWTEFRIGHRST